MFFNIKQLLLGTLSGEISCLFIDTTKADYFENVVFENIRESSMKKLVLNVVSAVFFILCV